MKKINIIWMILFLAWLMHHFYKEQDPLAFIVVITAFLVVYTFGRNQGMAFVQRQFKEYARERIESLKQEINNKENSNE